VIIVTLPSEDTMRLRVVQPGNVLDASETPIKVAFTLGLRGRDAKTDAQWSSSGPIGPGETFISWPVVSDESFDPTHCKLVCRYAPSEDWLLTITNHGELWASGTIPAGELEGPITFEGAAAVVDGDLVDFIGPDPQDATLGSVSIILAGR
jgi:hypothetical protein